MDMNIERLSEEIHHLYCAQYLKDTGTPYWTGGDYSKLDEKAKEYDRNIARWHLEAKVPANRGVSRIALMCGLPRSGKSTFAKNLMGDYVVVCPDDIRLALHGSAFIHSAEPFVWATAQIMVRALMITGHNVLVDATHIRRERRLMWREYGKPDIYWVDTPKDICIARGPELEHVINRMATDFQAPTDGEGNIIHVNTSIN